MTVKEYDYDRYLCSLFANRKHRKALNILYSFNLEIAGIYESVNEPMAGMLRLAWWRGEVEKIYDGHVTKHELLTSLAQIISEYNLSKDLLLKLIDSHQDDFNEQPFHHMAQLEEYVTNSSSSLLFLAAEILAAEKNEAINHVGIAWGVTGLLRSAYIHIATGRMAIFPQTLLDEAGISKDIYGGDKFLQNSKNIVKKLVGFAGFHIESSRKFKAERKALPVLLLATIAEGYLTQIEKNKYDIFTVKYKRPPVTTLLKLCLKRF